MILGDETLRLVAAGVLAALGLTLIVGGAFGAVRFGDVLTRLHALRAASYGAPLLLAGLAVEAWDVGVALRLALLAAAIAVTGPGLVHLIAHVAHRADVEPDARR